MLLNIKTNRTKHLQIFGRKKDQSPQRKLYAQHTTQKTTTYSKHTKSTVET